MNILGNIILTVIGIWIGNWICFGFLGMKPPYYDTYQSKHLTKCEVSDV